MYGKKIIFNLINKSIETRKNSYSPYSKIRVGAAVLTENNKIFQGTNIENASFGLTICAERAAIFNAVTHGMKKIKAIAITSGRGHSAFPCGACRQVIKEFSTKKTIVIIVKNKSNYLIKSIEELLPSSFNIKTKQT